MSSHLIYNTKEAIHKNAKETGIQAWALGCSCNECDREFDTMMDDSLSDTQQEKKQMSVKELVISDAPIKFVWRVNDKGNIEVAAYFGLDIPRAIATFDRSQAHLLMLYLQEQLGYVSISKDRLNE